MRHTLKLSKALTTSLSVAALFCAMAGTGFSQPSGVPKDQQYLPKDQTFIPLSPEESIKTIEVPKGYHLECVASEPMIEEPASFAFDADGALYVCEWRTYMQDENATGQKDPVSRVVKLVDTDGDGKMDKRTVFIDNILLPRNILPLKDRVLVLLTDETNVWAYFDDDNDGVSDRRELAYEGGKMGGNIEHQLSGLLWNLDNYIYNNDRRFKYVDGKMTAFPHSRSRISQWGLARDDDGRIYSSLAGGGNPAMGFQLPGGYPVLNFGKRDEHAPGYDVPYPICKVEDQSSGNYDFKNDHILTIFSATCGQTVLRSPLSPEWYGNVVTPEPVGRLIRMSKIINENGKRVAHNAFPKSEFIRSTDAFFRPVWSESGPDGCLYFSDMYRGIIQEKTWFPSKGDHIWVKRYERVKEWGMLKVFRHGRIYRLVPDGKKIVAPPKLKNLSSKELVKHLSSPNGWVRDTAQKLIVLNKDTSVVKSLESLAKSADDANAQLVALWSLEGLGKLSEATVLTALEDKEERVRIAAIHLAESFLSDGNKTIEQKVLAMTDGATLDLAMQLALSLSPARSEAYTAVQKKLVEENKDHAPLQRYMDMQKSLVKKSMLSASAHRGLKIYETLCITCHGPNGKGIKEAKVMMAPPLRKNRWFRANRVDVITRILLKGETGPIGNVAYGEGLMLPLEAAYDDKQLADLINYVGLTWNKWRDPVDAEQIKKIREEVKERKAPYTNEELMKMKK